MHIDTGHNFPETLEFRDDLVNELKETLIVRLVEDTMIQKGIKDVEGKFPSRNALQSITLLDAIKEFKFDACIGGARRDEEKSRAKERVFSLRSAQHRWDPKNQRPEPWQLYNTRKRPGESFRVFPISNWTENDVWDYIVLENIPVVPLYFAKERPVVERDGMLIMRDDERMKLRPGEKIENRLVRFRTLGCYPLTGAVESSAATLPDIIQEMRSSRVSERQGRAIDHDGSGSMEQKKQEGYF